MDERFKSHAWKACLKPTPWHFSSKVSLPRSDLAVLGKNQVFSIRVDMQYDLYVTTNPAHNYLVVKLLGTGFSAGNMMVDEDHARKCFRSNMKVKFGPGETYPGMAIEEANPKNKNQDGSWTVSSGLEVGSALNISWPPGLEISASYRRSSAATVTLQDFDVINQSNDATADFTYRLAMMEGVPVNDSNMDGELDRTNPTKQRFRRVPNLAKYQLTPSCEVIWRFPQDFNGKIKMHVELRQKIAELGFRSDKRGYCKFHGPNTVNYLRSGFQQGEVTRSGSSRARTSTPWARASGPSGSWTRPLFGGRTSFDDRTAALSEAGDVLIPIAEGAFGDEHIAGAIGEVLTGRVTGREREDQVTLFKSLGLAVQDLAASHLVYSRAVDRELGTWVDLGGERPA